MEEGKDDVRRRLKEKLRAKKNERFGGGGGGGKCVEGVLQDAILSTAGDDGDLLRVAQSLIKAPKADVLSMSKKVVLPRVPLDKVVKGKCEESDEEEAPPTTRRFSW